MVTQPAVILIIKSYQVAEEGRIVAGIDLNGADLPPSPLLRRLCHVGQRVLHVKLRQKRGIVAGAGLPHYGDERPFGNEQPRCAALVEDEQIVGNRGEALREGAD